MTDEPLAWQPCRYLIEDTPRMWQDDAEMNFVMIVNVIITNIIFTGEL